MSIDSLRVKDRILEILLDMVSVESVSGTEGENGIPAVFRRVFEKIPYLKEHPENFGFYPIKNDSLSRVVPYALLKGEGDDTVVCIHHTDVVGIDDYESLKQLALNPPELERALKEGKLEIDDEAKADLLSGEWIFGRGVADMKGGGSVHLALFEEYAKRENFKGNIVVIGVPDEENLSAGMLSAIDILKDLREKHGLNYVLLLDAESDQRQTGVPMFADGSIGKIMPIVYVRGVQAHSGRVFEGLNSVHILSEIIARTDANSDFCESSGNSVSPPPTWLYARDSKPIYDVTCPASSCGCMNLFMLEKNPEEHVSLLFKIAEESMTEVIRRQNENFRRYAEMDGQDAELLPYRTSVKMFQDVYSEALKDSGDVFKAAFDNRISEIKNQISQKELTIIEASKSLIELTLAYRSDLSPVVVIGLVPPYYPAVNNARIKERMGDVDRAMSTVRRHAEEVFGDVYETENYYAGISDLSYGMFTASDETVSYIENNMLLWGDVYHVPLSDIRELTMPVLNIGPHGKNIHKHAERVHREELLCRVPELIDVLLSELFGN